ncbi:MAG: hypothetical protein ACLSUW_06015 [Akkermansia sp.]
MTEQKSKLYTFFTNWKTAPGPHAWPHPPETIMADVAVAVNEGSRYAHLIGKTSCAAQLHPIPIIGDEYVEINRHRRSENHSGPTRPTLK